MQLHGLPPAENGDVTRICGTLSALTSIIVEPVGLRYEALSKRREQNKTLSFHSWKSHSSADQSESDSTDNEDDEDEHEAYLKTLDPKRWKEQDHYKVLGLDNMRYKATDDDIKIAYKKKVLKHHPDKRRARGRPVGEGEDDYFTTITRAWEQLGDVTRRISYDSVDPTFDDAVPSGLKDDENFLDVFEPVFQRNARFSTKKRIPKIGTLDSSYDEVNSFYSFWFAFESWREFSYLDEEEKEKGENREERRWIEKQNKAARLKRKKEEGVRIRQLAENAYACDPRVARFKDEEKRKKEAAKQAKRDAAQARNAEAKRKQEEEEELERKRKEEEEMEQKAKAEAEKKDREIHKKAMKKERKSLRNVMKEFDYFATDESSRVTNLQDVDRLAELLTLMQLQELNEALQQNKASAQAAFDKSVNELNSRLESEKLQQLERVQRQQTENASARVEWSHAELQSLTKAVKLFPAGTQNRWTVISSFIQEHIPGSTKTSKEVMAQTKELIRNDTSLKSTAEKHAFDNFESTKKEEKKVDACGGLSARYDTLADQQIGETGSNPAPWSTEEQKLLEQALRTFPASVPDRWDRVAETLPHRSRKDCMRRYKELCEIIRAKKLAQAAAGKK